MIEVRYLMIKAVAYAGFFNVGVSVRSHRDDVKILQLQCSSKVLKCIGW